MSPVRPAPKPLDTPPLFRSFFLGGFECSSHVNGAGDRLDMIAATGHDRSAREDYARLRRVGIRTARDGVRWHLVETAPYRYDWSGVLPMVRAARGVGVQVVWDLCHYGWPDDLDILSPEFLERFAAFAGAFARLLAEEGEHAPLLSPMNEISFLSWAAGEVAYVRPFHRDQGMLFKAQLIRATVAGVEAIRAAAPAARIVHIDPAIHVHEPDDATDWHREMAAGYSLSMFEAWDMISGRLCPELGGRPEYLDVVGINYYPHNQWVFKGEPYSPALAIPRGHPRYRPFRQILADVWERYRRPLFLGETGADGRDRAPWLRYVGREVRAAIRSGVPVEGVCLYPVVNFPWWDDGHHLKNALWDYPPHAGAGRRRATYRPLLRELARQRRLFAGLSGR